MYDSVLNSNSQYKSLLISARTTVDELISLLLNCYNSKERVEQFSLYEVNNDKEQQRKLHPDDRPLQVQQTWLPSHECHFLIRRNPDYLPLSRRKVTKPRQRSICVCLFILSFIHIYIFFLDILGVRYAASPRFQTVSNPTVEHVEKFHVTDDHQENRRKTEIRNGDEKHGKTVPE